MTKRNRPSPKRSRAMLKVLKTQPHQAASAQALSRHARKVALARGPRKRSEAAKKAARTRKHAA